MTVSCYAPPPFGTPEMARLLESPTPEFTAFLRSPAYRPWVQAQLRRCRREAFLAEVFWASVDWRLPPVERESKARRALARAERLLDTRRRAGLAGRAA